MASVLPSCIGNTFCSHRQAAFFLLATLIPFFSPFLVLCLPFLILFLAPMSFLVCSLLLLNMLQVSLRPSCRGEGAVRPRTGLEEKIRAEEAGEGRKCEGLPESGESEGSKGQSMAASGVKDAKDLHTIPAGFSDLLSVEHDDAKELDVRHEMEKDQLDARHGMDEKQEELHGVDEKQEEPNLMDEIVEKREQISSRFSREEAEEEGLEVLPSSSAESLKEDQEAIVKGMPPDQEEKPMRYEDLHTIPAGFSNLLSVEHDDAKELDVRHEKDEKEELDARHGMDEKQEELHGMDEKQEETVEKREKISSGFGRGEAEEEGLEFLPSSSTESTFYGPKEDQEATVKRMPSDQEEKPMRPEEEQAIREGTDDSEDLLKDKLHFKTTLPAGLEKEILTEFPSTHEHGLPHSPSIEAPSIAYPPCDIPDEEQGHDSSRDLKPTEEFYEVPGKLPGTEPDVHESRDKFDEVPSKDTSSNRTSEIETHLVSGEPSGQQPPLSTEKQSGSGHLSDLEKQDLLTLKKKEIEGVEPHGSSSSDHIERVAAETFAEELQDDEKPQLLQDTEHFQEGMPASNMDASFQLDAAEQDLPFERGSSTASPPQRPIESVGIQDTMQEEQRILADIDAIKKIIGYEGDIHASVMEQITSLYLFLGMELYWDAEVEDLESARREVEVLKVVVGVK